MKSTFRIRVCFMVALLVDYFHFYSVNCLEQLYDVIWNLAFTLLGKLKHRKIFHSEWES